MPVSQHHTKSNESYFRNYEYASARLSKLEQSLVKPFSRYMMQPQPAQNPEGYRKIDQRAVEFSSLSLEKLEGLGAKKVEVVDFIDASKIDAHVSNSNGKLVAALVSPPPFLDWAKGINSHEDRFAYNKPDRLVATMQWMGMALTLLDHGVKLYIVKPSPERPEGVFTCDIGFVIGEQLFMSNMFKDERKPEMATIRNGTPMPCHLTAEGGDIYVFKNGVFVGKSRRTSAGAAEFIAGKVQRQVVPVRLNKISLHFDVPILPIDGHDGNGGGAMVYYPGVHARDISKLEKVYGAQNVHRMSKEVFEDLRANVQIMGAGIAMVDFGNTHVERTLNRYGFATLLEVPFFEIKKGGGSHHCSMLKLVVE